MLKVSMQETPVHTSFCGTPCREENDTLETPKTPTMQSPIPRPQQKAKKKQQEIQP
jgi:hypothetical protein